MPLPAEVGAWRDRAEIDHIGPFVKAWAAFNAWYRHASSASRDAEGILFVHSRVNPVRSGILPLLDPTVAPSPDSVEFRSHVAALHAALDSYRLETSHSGRIERVSFRSIPIGRPQQLPHQKIYRRTTYRISKVSRQWVSTVIPNSGVPEITITQDDYDVQELTSNHDFVNLSSEKRDQLRSVYMYCDPRPMMDLLTSGGDVILAGTITFSCSCEQLFAGLVVNIYRMRNMLLHGELNPTPSALSAYEHAYHIIRRLLHECR